jgi:hypothetical protein
VKRCPQCGAQAEEAEAHFCAECGSPLLGEDADSGAGPVARLSSASRESVRHDGDAAAVDESCSTAYVREVQQRLADGAIDADDEAALENVRRKAGLSEAEAAALRTEAKAPFVTNAPEQGRCPLLVEINDAHFYMEGLLGVLDFRLTNMSGQPLERIKLTLAGKRLGEAETSLAQLPPRANERRLIQIEPDRAGEHLVDITVRFRTAGIAHTWTAQTLFKVLRHNESIESLTIHIDQSTKLTGEKIGFGQSIRKEVHEGLISGLIRDVNDLLQQKFAPSWQELPLVSRDTMRGLRIVPELAARTPWLSKATLVMGDGFCRTLIIAKPAVSLGRNRKNDIVIRVLPKSPENDPLTLRLQGHAPHCSVELTADGLRLVDHHTAHGTWLDGKRVSDVADVALDRPTELNLAGVLCCRFVPLRDHPRRTAEEDKRYQRLGLFDESWKLGEQAGIRGVLIERISNLAEAECYLIVYRWVDVPAELPPAFRGTGPAFSALRIVNIRGQLWVEVRGDEPTLKVEKVALDAGSVLPVTPGVVCDVGGWHGGFTMATQVGLEGKADGWPQVP